MRRPDGRIRAVVLGAGEWAVRYHLPALRALREEIPVDIAGIWNRTEERALVAARQFGIARAYASLEEALEAEGVDCYIVLVNSSALIAVVSKLLPRRLPIFTEKPPGRSFAEASWLAESVDVPNLVAFNRRYMPINRRFKELSGAIPDAYFAECRFYRNGRRHDRFILETGLHGINFMEYLCGPIAGARTERRRIPGTGADLWVAAISFESGMHGVIKFLPDCGSSIERYEIHGQDTSIYLHCPQAYTSDHPGKIVVHEKGRLAATILDESGEDPLRGAGMLDEYRDFFRSIRTGEETASNFRNARNTMKVAEEIDAAGGR